MRISDWSSDVCSSDLPSGHADGHGRHRRGALERLPGPQPQQSEVVQPRPLRALQRARLDAAVRAAAPVRLRPADRADQAVPPARIADPRRSEEHTSELPSLMRISYAVFCLKKKNTANNQTT